jgi:hypothetical protein
MKIPGTSALFILLCSGLAMAQTPYDRPESTQVTPGTQLPELKLVTGNESRHARDADARHCLALKNDLQIIRCAEKYRYVGARSSKASAPG